MQTICPDPKCQKLVEEKLAFEKAKSDKIKADFDQRAADKKILRAQISFAKKKKWAHRSELILSSSRVYRSELPKDPPTIRNPTKFELVVICPDFV